MFVARDVPGRGSTDVRGGVTATRHQRSAPIPGLDGFLSATYITAGLSAFCGCSARIVFLHRHYGFCLLPRTMTLSLFPPYGTRIPDTFMLDACNIADDWLVVHLVSLLPFCWYLPIWFLPTYYLHIPAAAIYSHTTHLSPPSLNTCLVLPVFCRMLPQFTRLDFSTLPVYLRTPPPSLDSDIGGSDAMSLPPLQHHCGAACHTLLTRLVPRLPCALYTLTHAPPGPVFAQCHTHTAPHTRTDHAACTCGVTTFLRCYSATLPALTCLFRHTACRLLACTGHARHRIGTCDGHSPAPPACLAATLATTAIPHHAFCPVRGYAGGLGLPH